MALRKSIEVQGKSTVETDFGVIETGVKSMSFSAYIRVSAVYGTKTKVTATVSFEGNTEKFSKQYEVPMSVESGSANFIAQVYAHLKTLPEFAGATDC
jgi:hypothetical protein